MSKKNAFSQAFSELISTVNPVNGAEEEAKPNPIAPDLDERIELNHSPLSPRPLESEPPVRPTGGGKTTIIAAGTTVDGNLVVEGSAEIDGCLNGDIECSGCLTVSGEIVGGSRISEIDVVGARIEGNIESKGSVNIRKGAVVIGNINGQSMQIFGALKGNIDLPGHLTIGSSAVIIGDIRAGSVDIQNGAVIDGHLAIQSAGQASDVFAAERKRQNSSN